MQGFRLVASQLRGKLATEGSSSSHHGKKNNTITFEYFYDWLNGYTHKNSNVKSLRDNQQSTSLEEHEMRKNHPICEKSLDTPLQKKIEDNEVENQLPQFYRI